MSAIDDPTQRNQATNAWYGTAQYPASEAQAVAMLGADSGEETTRLVFEALENTCEILAAHRKDLFLHLDLPVIGKDAVLPVHFGLMPTEIRPPDKPRVEGEVIVVLWQPQSSPDQFTTALGEVFNQANILLRQQNIQLPNIPTR